MEDACIRAISEHKIAATSNRFSFRVTDIPSSLWAGWKHLKDEAEINIPVQNLIHLVAFFGPCWQRGSTMDQVNN